MFIIAGGPPHSVGYDIMLSHPVVVIYRALLYVCGPQIYDGKHSDTFIREEVDCPVLAVVSTFKQHDIMLIFVSEAYICLKYIVGKSAKHPN